MKAILEFNLPEDNAEHRDAIDGWRWRCACWDFDQWLRSEYKYQGNEPAYEFREKFREIISDNNLNLDDE